MCEETRARFWHADAVARVRKLTAEDLDRPIVFFNGQAMPVRDILMDFMVS